MFHAAFYFIIGLHEYGFNPEKRIKVSEPNSYFIQSLSIQAFAFHCHPGVGPALARLVSPTRQRQYGTLAAVIAAGALCYLTGRNMRIISHVVFHDYDTTQVFTMVVASLYALFLLLTTPLTLFAARVALHDLRSR
jgi:hypothetical protein